MNGISIREEIETEAQGKHHGRDWGGVSTSQGIPVQLATQEGKRKSWNRFSPRTFREHGFADILISDF